MSNTPKEILEHLISGQDLTEAAMTETVLQIMDGTWPPAQVAAFLTALRIKGETVEELTGAVRAMRAPLGARMATASISTARSG